MTTIRLLPEQIAELRLLLGDGKVVADGDTRLRYATDAWPVMRKLRRLGYQDHVPDVVVLPHSSDEVVEVLRFAGREGVGVTPFGGGSNVVGATTTDGGIVLSTERMNRILDLDVLSQLVLVEAGVRGDVLEDYLAGHGYTLGHYPQSLALSTVGGWIAMRAAGTYSTGYGGIEALVAGLTVVTAAGEPRTVHPAPRQAGGLNPLHLFIGSEGTLGVITSAWLQVSRRPEHEHHQAYLLPDFDTGLRVLREVAQRDVAPALVRLYNEAESLALLGGAREEGSCVLLCSHVGARPVVEAKHGEVDRVCAAAGGRALGSEPVTSWLTQRYGAQSFWETTTLRGRILDTLEVCAPWSVVGAVWRRLEEELGAYSSSVYLHASHIYPMGTSLYATFVVEGTDDWDVLQRHAAAWHGAIAGVVATGGLPVHHHGVGLARAHWFMSSDRDALFQPVRTALDPDGVLNRDNLGQQTRWPAFPGCAEAGGIRHEKEEDDDQSVVSVRRDADQPGSGKEGQDHGR